MTKEEAIEELKRQYLGDSERIIQAKNMAIEAFKENEKLKQELEAVKQELATFKALC